MLTDDTLRKVRETVRIDEVASDYLTLHRSGKDFVALCPFHDERHPSFRISPARNIGKCFSCGEAADPIRPAQGGESHTLRGTHPALRGLQGRARLPRLRHTVRRGAMRHGAHRGAYPGDTEAGRAGDALSRSRSGGTAEHGPVRPYTTVRGVRRQPTSPARRHGPGRGVPPERERRAGTPSTGGYPRLPLLPHPPSGFPPSHGHHRHQRGVGRDRPPLLPAGRVPEAWGAIRGDGYTDGGITAGNVCRHRPEKRNGSGTEEGSRRPHARPATRKGVTAFLPHAP